MNIKREVCVVEERSWFLCKFKSKLCYKIKFICFRRKFLKILFFFHLRHLEGFIYLQKKNSLLL